MGLAPEQILQRLGPLITRWTGESPTIQTLAGHASTRLYHRIHGRAGSVVVMQLGPTPMASEEIGDEPEITSLPFLDIQKELRARGAPVPEVLAYLEEDGLLLLEDLGDTTLESVLVTSSDLWPTLSTAIDALVSLQQATSAAGTSCAYRRLLGTATLRAELDHFSQWLLFVGRGVTLSPAAVRTLQAQFDLLATLLAELPPIWTHRDYQSRNLMLTPMGLRVIDFQDAALGPPPYDLVALLRDSYIDISPELAERGLEHYLAIARMPLSAEAFREAFWLQSIQRKAKDAGRFVFIDRVKRNPSFLPFIPRSLRYVGEGLARAPRLAPLRTVLADLLAEVDVSRETSP